ncbi:dynein light chain 1, cytoplasmic-like [Drosophila serrata]|uniref:dynein light chain 1, cytoplasmic-like n=2 Tax=Drosophila serrata TaxID=7274 RepID=UPI000A1CF3F6|nr:dynein light chain 1, cytoplasmic-like [Drosophila serrata]XP_020803712.1 dynein light chain 1, cytoplasmic-like [Drosophila serrata]XP_020805840.1 dynein light chain 1, cytoplasmic-like [Drosophila serrata]XP_020812242.1 dynein light chain 1, cytoplasmic-like [Drosophila serrata]
MSSNKADIRSTDMSEEMQKIAIDCARQALNENSIENKIAEHIKNQFDIQFKPKWHCIVGTEFGSYVSHEPNHFIYFYLGKLAILLFKRG